MDNIILCPKCKTKMKREADTKGYYWLCKKCDK